LETIETLIIHRKIANTQKKAYYEYIRPADIEKDNLLGKDKIVIEMDFKQKIKIGMSPRQIGQEFYDQEQRSCLGT
jgi:hypothetical protein